VVGAGDCLDLDLDDNNLIPAFLNLDDEAGELDEWLADFSEMHAPWALGQLVSTRMREFEVNCNWKGFIEVFNEYYI